MVTMNKWRLQRLVGLAVVLLLAMSMMYVHRKGRVGVLTCSDTGLTCPHNESTGEGSRRGFPLTSSLRQSPTSHETNVIQSLIKFEAVTFNPDLDNLTFDNAHLYPCSQPNGPGPDGVVDLMCVPRPKYLPAFKNPCHRDGSSGLKCMPYYNILGFDKCGTTDLSFRITSHPSILKSDSFMGKEVYFWSWLRLGLWLRRTEIVSTLDNYTRAFRSAARSIAAKEGQPGQPVVGDGSPMDAWDFAGWPLDPQNKGFYEPRALSPHLMRHIFKHPRFIILMRDPVDRLYSDYMFMEQGETKEEFDEDVADALDMMNACLGANETRLCFFSRYLNENVPTRLHIGCYSIFLREWLSVFHRKHFLFLRTEDYKKDTRETLEAVFAFLGVETLPDFLMEPILQQPNVRETIGKSRAGPMLERTRQKLKDFYAPCNANLRELLGDDKYLWLDT